MKYFKWVGDIRSDFIKVIQFKPNHIETRYNFDGTITEFDGCTMLVPCRELEEWVEITEDEAFLEMI